MGAPMVYGQPLLGPVQGPNMPRSAGLHVANQKRNLHGKRPVGIMLEFQCGRCQRTWWGTQRNKTCKRCNVEAPKVPFEKRVGLGHFKCTCGRNFVGVARGDVKSKCHGCNALVSPWAIEPPGEMKRKSSLSHNCELCHGEGYCPLMNRFYE